MAEIRRLEGEQKAEAGKLVALGFNEDPEGAAVELDQPLWDEMISYGAFVDGLLVGHSGSFDFAMTVPGGTAKVLGVTAVVVSPLARRRGVATALMRHLLDEAAAGGYQATALWASEPKIYGRFGYGNAASLLSLKIPRDRGWLRPVPGAEDVRLRLIPAREAAELIRTVQNADAARRPGLFGWHGNWVERVLADKPDLREGASPVRVLEARNGDAVSGYATWRNRVKWTSDRPGGTVEVGDVRATDAATYAAIWRVLADYDLMTDATVERPVDDPLLWLLDDVRAAHARIAEGLFVRLVDVPAALTARRYLAPVDAVLQVTDDLRPDNAGRWRLTGGPDGASCEPTTAPADIALDVRDLAALYLGGGLLPALVRAGLARESRPGVALRLGFALGSEIAPWADMVF
jgi:predicted acetyltransferase